MPAVECPAHLDARELSHPIRAIARLQRRGRHVLLPDRLGTFARIDAARAENEQALDAKGVCRLNDIGLNGEIVVNKLRGRLLFAKIPPRFAAARNTYSGRTSGKNGLQPLNRPNPTQNGPESPHGLPSVYFHDWLYIYEGVFLPYGIGVPPRGP
jgi:hypothetical protein